MADHPQEYNEDAVLTDYIWRNFRHLLDRLERLGEKAVLAEQKTQAADGALARMLRSRWGSQNDPQVVEALQDGPDAFRRRVRDRVLNDHHSEITICRCPSCEQIVVTPLARQCFWCGHDWHAAG